MSYNFNYFKNYGTDDRYYWQSVGKDIATHFSHSLLVYGDMYPQLGAYDTCLNIPMNEACEVVLSDEVTSYEYSCKTSVRLL